MEENFDLNEIREQFKKVITYSQGFFGLPMDGIDAILNKWLEAKSFFIERMQGKLIYEYPEIVSFELNKEAKQNKIEHFAEMVENHYDNYPLAHFLYHISVEDFYNNKTSQSYHIQEGLTVPENFKTVKAFKFFESDSEKLKELQSEASRIIQENVISGHLCLSVHPLDFLSASENAHNWRSCHALDGEYRSGNLNYLCDTSTVICYLRAEKDAILPHFPSDIPWNSKKWRVWFFFSDDKTMLFAGRQYPFEANNGINLIKDKILPQIGMDFWTPFSRDRIMSHEDEYSGQHFRFHNLIPVGGEAIPIKKLVTNGKYTYHYNDILNSHFYISVYSFRRNKADNSPWHYEESYGMTSPDTRFVIGDSCPCPICGYDSIGYGEAMVCPGCCDRYGILDNGDYEECEVCGTSLYYEDLITLDISEIRVCPNCYQRETYICQVCGATDLPEYIKYREGDPRCLCESCYNSAMEAPKKINYREFRGI